MDEVGLGRLLQNARKASGLTQQQLCQKAGLSYSTLAKIERGAIKAPSIFTIQSIAGALGTSLNDLMGDFAPTTPQTTKKRSKSGVRFVYFDVNGCLVRFFHQAFTKLSLDTGVRADLVESAFWHYNDEVCRGQISLDEFNQQFAARLGVPGVRWQDYYLEAVDPIDEMPELLNWVSQNYEVGLLTNIMPGMVQELMQRSLIPNVPYAAIIDSSQVGSIKPEAKIYEVAQVKSGVQPGEILLVDDERTNLMAAEKMGWHVWWFDDYRPADSVQQIRSLLEPEA